MLFPIGAQRVGVVTATLDNVETTELFETERTGETVAWVDNCLFEIQNFTTPATVEQQTVETTTTTEVAWWLAPIVDGQVPAVDEDDNPLMLTVASISSAKALRHDGLDYEMRADSVRERDIRGRDSHLFAMCERQTG